MEHIHELVNKQFQLWHLIIASCDYGIDCYWKKREGYFMTISYSHIVLKRWFVAIHTYNRLPRLVIRKTLKHEG